MIHIPLESADILELNEIGENFNFF